MTDAGDLLRYYAERLLNLRDESQKGKEALKAGRGRTPALPNESSIHPCAGLARAGGCIPAESCHASHFSRDIPQTPEYRLDLGTVSYVPHDPGKTLPTRCREIPRR